MTYTEPLLTIIILLFAGGLWRGWRCKRLDLILAGLVALILISWPPMDWLLARHLEAGYLVRPFNEPPTDAIVVLSAGVSPAQWERPYELPDRETWGRCRFAADLFKRWRTVPVLVSGGPDRAGRKPYAHTMKDLLVAQGVPPELVWVEDRSQSTHENAVLSSAILRQHGARKIALVVESQSMRRAEASFRKQGMDVIPAPSEFRYLGAVWEELLPRWNSIHRNEITLHETLGLIWYKIRGWV